MNRPLTIIDIRIYATTGTEDIIPTATFIDLYQLTY